MFSGLKKAIKTMDPCCCLLIILGSSVQAFGVANIHAFSDVTEGGMIGLTLLIFHFTGISPAFTAVPINIVCYAFGRHVMGQKFLAYSVVSVAVYSISYKISEGFAPLWPGILHSPFICALIGAVFVGVGAGLSVLGGGAPGADDALAMALSQKLHCGIQYIYLACDVVILLLSLSYIPFSKIAYSLFTVVLSGQIVGWIQKLKKT